VRSNLRGQPEKYYVGDTVRIRAKTTDPETLDPLIPNTGTVEWWAPGVDRTDPPAVTSNLTARPASEDMLLYQQTDGWAPGRWTYKVTVVGTEFTNSAVGAITLYP